MNRVLTICPFDTETDFGILHQQNKEWLSEIEFNRDEVAFFFSLKDKLSIRLIPENLRSSFENIEKILTVLTINEFEKIKITIENHENNMEDLITGKSSAKEIYYKKHYQLGLAMKRFQINFNVLRKQVIHTFSQIIKKSNK